MSDTPQKKDKKVDAILLGTAGALIIGLFVFSSPDKKEDGHADAGHEAPVEQAEQGAPAANNAQSNEPVQAKIVAKMEAVPDSTPVVEPVELSAKQLAELKATVNEMEKKNAELQAALKAGQGASQQALALQAEAYQARYEDLLNRFNDLTKGFSKSMEDHQKHFIEKAAK